MRRSTILVALAATAYASPPRWPFERHSHPGWPEPSVYTPAQPKPSWPHHSYPWPSYSIPSEHTSSPSPTVTSGTSSTAGSAVSSSTQAGTSGTSIAACASVSELVASFASQSPSATPTVPAELAYECINSVPFNASAAVALMDSMRPYLNWQTTIEYLKDPPAEYAAKVQAPYDFYANFNRIYENAVSGSYDNEYAFGFDLYLCFQKAHDGHFVIYPDSVTAIFSFGRTSPLVSVSVDGTSIPKVYVYADVLAASFGNISYTPSYLTQINGQNSTEWLLNFSEYGSLQDPDALWNNMFYILAQVSLGSSGTGTGTFSGGGRGRWIYPGPTTSLTFANGTTVTTENYARVLAPFDNITTGEDIYQAYFIPPPGEPEPVEEYATMTTSSAAVTATSSIASTSSAAASPALPAPGYPSPIVRSSTNLNGGYFLEGDGYDDVAVLNMASFVGAVDFQPVNTYFLNRAVAANKTKLIIDVSANGGGTILQGYDIFKQLFPQILPYGATRFRAHEAFDLIGQEVSFYAGLVPRSLNDNDTVQSLLATAYDYQTDADVNYKPFTSWAEKFGPHAFGPQPDNFTSIIRWNLSDVLIPDDSGGIYVSGYLNRSNITTQPFAAENIVVVYDGYCASTCTIFSELMRQQGGVKTIALGGRPNRDIIQAVGGVKGTNDYEYEYILDSVSVPFELQYLHNASYYNTTALGQYSDLPLWRTTASVVNARDGIRQGDASETPLQFRYETADCRLYYTPSMVVDETAVWKTVADTAFNGVDHCVAGNYTAGTGVTKRHAKIHHGVRRDLDLTEHLEAISSVWTGKDGLSYGGDSIMLV